MQIRCAAVIVSKGLFADKIDLKGGCGGEKVTTLEGVRRTYRCDALPLTPSHVWSYVRSPRSELTERVGNVVAVFDLCVRNERTTPYFGVRKRAEGYPNVGRERRQFGVITAEPPGCVLSQPSQG